RAALHGWGLSWAARALPQLALQLLEPLAVMTCAARGSLVDGFPDLPDARRPDGPSCGQLQIAVLPFQAEEFEQPRRRGLRIAHERVVFEVENVLAVECPPVRHDPPILPVVVSNVPQIER